MISKLANIESVLFGLAAGVDHLDNHEAESEALFIALSIILGRMGYPLDHGVMAATTISAHLSYANNFQAKYMHAKGFAGKTAVLYGAVETAILKIESGFNDTEKVNYLEFIKTKAGNAVTQFYGL